jgi:multisubunit Na+/H+ antiporter MnhB subunit
VTSPLAYSAPLLGILVVGGSIVLALLAFHFLFRRLPQERLRESNDVGGLIFSAIGVLFTVILAFMVVVVWDQFSTARGTSDSEVTRLSNLFRDAQVFPTAERERIRRSLVCYAGAVVEKEWSAMASGEPSPIADKKYRQIWMGYYALTPRGDKETAFYQESLSRLNELGQYRRLRLLEARDSFPAILWVFLIAGAVAMIGYTYMLGWRESRFNAIGVAGLAGLSALALFLIFALNHPFSGTLKVTPEAFSGWYAEKQGTPAARYGCETSL